MQRFQAFQYELRPDGQQQRQMRRFAGSCRYVFNKALALQQECHQVGEKKLGYASLCKLLVQWKAQPETHWLSETPSQALQQVWALRGLPRSRTAAFCSRWPASKGMRHACAATSGP